MAPAVAVLSTRRLLHEDSGLRPPSPPPDSSLLLLACQEPAPLVDLCPQQRQQLAHAALPRGAAVVQAQQQQAGSGRARVDGRGAGASHQIAHVRCIHLW